LEFLFALLEILNRLLQQIDAVLGVTEKEVAAATKEAAYLARCVVVIQSDAPGARFRFTADTAKAVRLRNECIVFGRRESEPPLEM